MNRKELLNTIENVNQDFRNWNTLKLREVQEGIITKEKYEEMRSVSEERTNSQIARIEEEIRNLRG